MIKQTQLAHRIELLDLLRGIAVLGILLMNIYSFGHIGQGYMNPTIGAGLSGYNKLIFDFSYLFADGRFMGIFSILFGAGIVLFSSRIEAKGQSSKALYYKRLFFLFLFGMAHAYLIWMGYILVAYSICGALVYLIRKWSTLALWIIAILFFSVPLLANLGMYHFVPMAEQEEIFSFFYPSQDMMNEQINAMQGSYLDQMPKRAEGAFELQGLIFIMGHFWKIFAQMILGILLFRNGFLKGTVSTSNYLMIGLGLFSFSFVISWFNLQSLHEMSWPASETMLIGASKQYVTSIIMAVSYIAFIALWQKHSLGKWLKQLFQKAGRMAFTNYIFSSIIATFIFYGHGLGLFNQLDRVQLYGIVLLIWIVLLVMSHFTLQHYKQGPLEAFWRRLTYGARK